jgi:hypothetical protein
VTEWNSFFQGELGAAAALAGLLFVAVSVNQARILELGRMADRGIETLLMLLLVLVVASLPLVPGQPVRWLGGEILMVASVTIVGLLPLQLGYLRQTDPKNRPRSVWMVRVSRFAMALIACAWAALLWRGDAAGLYVLASGILLSFVATGINAWVLLIEINR